MAALPLSQAFGYVVDTRYLSRECIARPNTSIELVEINVFYLYSRRAHNHCIRCPTFIPERAILRLDGFDSQDGLHNACRLCSEPLRNSRYEYLVRFSTYVLLSSLSVTVHDVN